MFFNCINLVVNKTLHKNIIFIISYYIVKKLYIGHEKIQTQSMIIKLKLLENSSIKLLLLIPGFQTNKIIKKKESIPNHLNSSKKINRINY